MKNLQIGQQVIANVPFKYVGHIQRKFQPVTITDFDGELIIGKTEKGKRVYFTIEDIKP